MNNSQEQIWRYLNGDMPLEEKESFEQALADDNQLKQAVKQEKELVQFLENKEAKSTALKNLSDVHHEAIAAKAISDTKQNTKPTIQRPIIRWLIPLAIAATVAIGYLFLPTTQSTPQEIYAAHFEPSEISFSTRGERNEVMITKAADLFNSGSYKAAVGFIEKLPENI